MISADRRLLGLACVFFFLCKSLWVLLPVQAMGIPRLGDDGLVYLWTGASTVLTPRLDTPAVRDIVALRQQGDDAGDAELDFLRARTTMRLTYVAASPFAMLTGLLVQSGLSHKAAFAGTELIIAGVLTASIAALGTALFGAAAAAVAVTILALALLPLQGIHYLVPGVLALALALLVLAELCRAPPRAWILFPATLVLGLTHAIGFVYIALCCAFALLLPAARQRALVVNWTPLIAIVLGGVAAFAFFRLAGGQAPATSGTGTLSLSGIPRNFAAALGYVGQSIASQPVTWVFGCGGLLLAARARRVEPLLLLCLVLALFLSAALFDITGYPGDLGARILVLAMMLVASAAGYGIVEAWRVKRIIFAAALVLFAGQMIIHAGATWLLMVENMNSRGEIHDEAAIRVDLAALPDNASIIWTEPDISMMAAFLEGATRFHALPYPMIERSAERDALIARARPGFIAAAIPKSLNTTARTGSTHFSPRRYGVSFADFGVVQIRLQGAAIDRMFLRLSRSPEPRDVRVSTISGGADCQIQAGEVQTLYGKTWLPLDLRSCSPDTIVTIASENRDLSLLGLSLTPPRPRINWPWGSPVLVLAQARAPGGSDAAFVFDWPSLIGTSLARDSNPSLVSDESGIVWLRTDIASRLRPPVDAGPR